MTPEDFDREVADATAVLTLPMIQSIANNEMPECFDGSRALIVSLSRMLMIALRQNEELVAKLNPPPPPPKIIAIH